MTTKQGADKGGERASARGSGGFIPGLVVGWLSVSLWFETRPVVEPDSAAWAREAFALPEEPARWSARELRILPGIGERRALDTVRARREHASSPRAPEPLRWEDVPGIGERTGASVREFLRARGVRELEVLPPR